MMNIHKILLISVSLFFTLATNSFAQKAKHPAKPGVFAASARNKDAD